MKIILGKLIKIYQSLTPFHVCRFAPTCSEYTRQAINKYGTMRGMWMGCKRIVRCNPFFVGGWDPVR